MVLRHQFGIARSTPQPIISALPAPETPEALRWEELDGLVAEGMQKTKDGSWDGPQY